MKKNISLILLLLLFITPVSLYARDETVSVDPLGNSYILNQLQMESDKEPARDPSEMSNGEIIFDNSFDDSLNSRSDEKKINNTGNEAIKELRKKDGRWHLVEYKVRKSDSVYRIAKKFNTDPAAIMAANNLTQKALIKESDILLVPSRRGITHKIRKGESLSSIADRYDVDVEKIASHNNIDSKKLIAGKKIFIPDATEKKSSLIAREHKKNSEKTKYIASRKGSDDPGPDTGGKLRLAWPIKGPITSGFGYRIHPFLGDKRFHCGLDIGAEIGTTVRAAGEGRVIFSGWKDQYGNLVVIQHKNNYITVYAHNSKLLVGVDETVTKGQKIALSGNTGAVTGAHLHFEIRKGIVPLNPSRILK